ncbi:MAG: hypothetical protein HY709_04950, partial [Candidatus Latescibacteria bacterium]|nr:hypothetical protein [Candidatus Latescibacterota bacterium]
METHPDSLLSHSFELVYYDPSPKFQGRTPFRDPENDPLTVEQRITYLKAYARLLRQMHGLGDDYLSSEVVSEQEVVALAGRLKSRPLPRHRQVVPLRFWRWKLQGTEGESWVTPDYDDGLWNELETPTVLDMGRAMLLRCTVPIEQAERVVLDVESIHDGYELWVNGQPADHHEGYEPHVVDITPLVQMGQENTVAIRIAEKPGYQIGIAGSIEVVGTSSTFIEDVFVKPVEVVEDQPARVRILTTVRNTGRETFSGRLAVRFSRWFPDEDETAAYEVSSATGEIVSGQAVELIQECVMPGAELWWPERPYLYKVEVVLSEEGGDPIDDYVDTVGIRTIRQRGGRLYLNGKRFFVRSFGNDLGFAPSADFHGSVCPPDAWIVRDLVLAKRANANTMRLHPWGFSGKPGEYNEYGWPEWGLPTDGTNYVRIAEIADQIGI